MNETEEFLIFNDRSHPSMIQINTIAYVLEIIYYTMGLVFTPAYIVLSKFARRFHPLLRFQIRILFIEILILSITRLTGVILRLIEAAVVHLPSPWGSLKDVFTIINLGTVTQIDFSVFLIAMERLLATYRIRSYEKSFHHPLLRLFILIYVLIPSNVVNFFMFMEQIKMKDLSTADMTFMNTVNVATTATYLIGILAMEASRILSMRQLKSEDRELSTSFQCKENLMVVRMIRPIVILLFITRLVQFFSKLFMFQIGISMGAIWLRIVTHLYNQSVAICFLLVPLLLIKNHANLTRFTRQTDVVEEVNGDVYFQSLMAKWS